MLAASSGGTTCVSKVLLEVWVWAGTKFPEDLTEHAEAEFGVSGGEVEAPDEATNFFLRGGGGARLQVAAGTESVEQERSEALEVAGSSGDGLFRMRGGFGIAREFVEADGYRLAEVHGAVLFARGDAQKPVAVAEVFVREPPLLRTEEQGDAGRGKAFADEGPTLFEAPDRVLQFAAASGRGSDDEGAVRDRFRHGFELLGADEHR